MSSTALQLLALGLGPSEIALLLVVMVFVFGPKRIPEIGESVGKALSGFRKATKEGEEADRLPAKTKTDEAE